MKGDNPLLNESKVVKPNIDFMSKLIKKLSLSEQVLFTFLENLSERRSKSVVAD
jgi:hypothetical protein